MIDSKVPGRGGLRNRAGWLMRVLLGSRHGAHYGLWRGGKLPAWGLDPWSPNTSFEELSLHPFYRQATKASFRGPAWAGKLWSWTHSLPHVLRQPPPPRDLQHLRTPQKWPRAAGSY